MKEILIDFLLELNAKGLINDYDLDYEKEANAFVKKNKKEQLTLTDVVKSFYCKHQEKNNCIEQCSICAFRQANTNVQ